MMTSNDQVVLDGVSYNGIYPGVWTETYMQFGGTYSRSLICAALNVAGLIYTTTLQATSSITSNTMYYYNSGSGTSSSCLTT
jgi:hypothetical protein